jgi:hypothetical protein
VTVTKTPASVYTTVPVTVTGDAVTETTTITSITATDVTTIETATVVSNLKLMAMNVAKTYIIDCVPDDYSGHRDNDFDLLEQCIHRICPSRYRCEALRW